MPTQSSGSKTHLRDCPECAREVSAWRRTVGRLDAWKLPKAPHARNFSFKPVGLAAAAAVMVGAFMMGRFSAPQLDAQKFRTELKSELSAEIQQGFARASIGFSESAGEPGVSPRRRLPLHDSKEMAQEFVQMINDLRADDRKADCKRSSRNSKSNTRRTSCCCAVIWKHSPRPPTKKSRTRG